MSDHDARRSAEAAARDSYGRLIAFLSARSRDLAAAEDALSDAFLAALQSWPTRGVPDRPEAWLLTVARRRLRHDERHRRVQEASSDAIRAIASEAQDRAMQADTFPDERLALLFACAHPAIDASARAPLMLQMVLGFDAARIASAFLVSPAAMSQRLVRAKARVRDAGIAIEVPEHAQLVERIDPVLEAIYAVYGTGWEEEVGGADQTLRHGAAEAIWLARLLVQLLPGEPEARGLLALMLHCEARREARRDPDGAFIPLAEQDVGRWSMPLIDEAERHLSMAAVARRAGPFQLEAAIQSAHASRVRGAPVPRAAIAELYHGLAAMAPTMAVLVGRAAAVAEASGAAQGMTLLQQIDPRAAAHYQPFWALRAHLHARLGQRPEANAAYQRAIGLTEDPAVRRFLLQQQETVTPPDPPLSDPHQ